MTTTALDNHTLEQLIDQHGLADILSEIVAISRAKSEHVSTNWQDHALAKAWDNAADALWQATLVAQNVRWGKY